MFCFIEKTESKYIYAENVSALFLYPEITPEYASCEEQMLISAHFPCLLSGDTPADVPAFESAAEYQIVSESSDCSFSVALPLAATGEEIVLDSESIDSEEFITIENSVSEESSPMFLVQKHIPSNFCITVCNGEYYLYSREPNSFEYRKYCIATGGFVPHGMELKIRVQSFKL